MLDNIPDPERPPLVTGPVKASENGILVVPTV